MTERRTKPRTGSCEYVPAKAGEPMGHYKVRFTSDVDGSRPWVHCKPSPKSKQAKEKAKDYIQHKIEKGELAGVVAVPRRRKAKATAAAPAPVKGETFADWSDRWCKAREARGHTTVDDDRARLRKWIVPTLGPLAVATFTRDDVEALVEHLDRAIAEGRTSWRTARNVWALTSKACSDAANAKDRSLRARKDNPALGVRAPDRGVTKAKAYLYPSEFDRLVGCRDVPVQWRRVYAVTTYLYARASEARGLEWADVDLEHGLVLIHRTVDDEGRADSTKGMAARRFAIEPELLPLLKAMHAEANGEGRVLPRMPTEKHLAPMLRRHLTEAKVERAELHKTDATRKQLRFHDLRATGLTWMAVRGDDPLKIKQRAGHAAFTTTEGYIRDAEAVRDGFGNVFPPLPAELLERGDSSGESSLRFGRNGHAYGRIRGSLSGRRDLKTEGPTDRPAQPHDPRSRPASETSKREGQVGDRRTRTNPKDDSIAPVATSSMPAPDCLDAAIHKAAEAGQWGVVELLAQELKTRREAAPRDGGAVVHDLLAERARRRKE